MPGGFTLFKASDLWIDCEQCRLRVNLSRAGACRRCRRILCHTHLYGSFFRRLLVDLGAKPLCVRCRHEQVTPTQAR